MKGANGISHAKQGEAVVAGKDVRSSDASPDTYPVASVGRGVNQLVTISSRLRH